MNVLAKGVREVGTGSTPVPDLASACGPSSHWAPRTRTSPVRHSDRFGPRPRRTGSRPSTLAGLIRDAAGTRPYLRVPLSSVGSRLPVNQSLPFRLEDEDEDEDEKRGQLLPVPHSALERREPSDNDQHTG